jgi:hypothetical protein
MYSVLSQLTIQPQHVDEFITLIRDHASESLRDEPGTLGFDVIEDQATPNHFMSMRPTPMKRPFTPICKERSANATSHGSARWSAGNSIVRFSSGRGSTSHRARARRSRRCNAHLLQGRRAPELDLVF